MDGLHDLSDMRCMVREVGASNLCTGAARIAKYWRNAASENDVRLWLASVFDGVGHMKNGNPRAVRAFQSTSEPMR